MVTHSKKNEIIQKIKNYISKSGRPISRGSEWNITEDVAKKIQSGVFELSELPLENVYNPPYLKIADQLQAENDQIFEAAVYNLTKIAQNNPNYRKHIYQLIEYAVQTTTHGEEQKKYAQEKLNLIK